MAEQTFIDKVREFTRYLQQIRADDVTAEDREQLRNLFTEVRQLMNASRAADGR